MHSLIISDLLRPLPISAIGKSIASVPFSSPLLAAPVSAALSMHRKGFWLLGLSPRSPVLSSLLPEHVEAVGINTGGVQSQLAEGKHHKLCIHTGLWGLIYTAGALKSGLQRYISREKFKLTSCHT